jgi:hypothetical protein
MKRRATFSVALLVLPGALLLWAADPWKESPYTEWTEKDAQRVLEKSPWAKRINQAGRTRRSTGSTRMEGAGAVGMPVNIGAMRHAFTVVWFSSLTVRQAFVRQRRLEGTSEKEVDEKLVSRQPLQYELRVQGPAVDTCCPQPYSCYLKPKRSKQAILPSRVQFVAQPGGNRTEVRFHFLRSLAGKPVISPDEKKVEFHCQSDVQTFKAVFDLQRMTREGRPDL